MKKILIGGLILCLLAACSDNKRLEQALQFAGENRGELEKVLDFYKHDGEKYAAARFFDRKYATLLCLPGGGG